MLVFIVCAVLIFMALAVAEGSGEVIAGKRASNLNDREKQRTVNGLRLVAVLLMLLIACVARFL